MFMAVLVLLSLLVCAWMAPFPPLLRQFRFFFSLCECFVFFNCIAASLLVCFATSCSQLNGTSLLLFIPVELLPPSPCFPVQAYPKRPP